MSYSATAFFPGAPGGDTSFASHPAPSSAPSSATATSAQRWHAPAPPMQSSWGYPVPPASDGTPLAPHSASPVAPPVSSDSSSMAQGGIGAPPPLMPSASTPGLPSPSMGEIRAQPLTSMTGGGGSPLSIRLTLPQSALEPRMPGQQDAGQFHIVFGSFLVVPHVGIEPPPAQGFASVVLSTNVPILSDLPGVNPDSIMIRVQARLPGSRAPSYFNVGTYRMLHKAPAHMRPNGTPASSPDLWNMPQQVKLESQYGPVRANSARASWDPANPYMRGRYSDHGPGRPGSPNRAVAPRSSQGMMTNGAPHGLSAPALVRAPQSSNPNDNSFMNSPLSNRPRAQLKLQGDLGSMAYGWTVDELQEGRRLVQFWRKQEGTTIHATFRPIMLDQYVKNSIVVSCIFRADRNECYITSVDTILLLEALVASRFSIEEKNRIRRNLEGFHPETVRKHSGGSEDFFKRIMNFKDPKPRTIAKDVKTFSWKVLEHALCKVIEKYVGDVPEMDVPPPRPTDGAMHFPPAPPPGHGLPPPTPHGLPSHGLPPHGLPPHGLPSHGVGVGAPMPPTLQ